MLADSEVMYPENALATVKRNLYPAYAAKCSHVEMYVRPTPWLCRT